MESTVALSLHVAQTTAVLWKLGIQPCHIRVFTDTLHLLESHQQYQTNVYIQLSVPTIYANRR